MTTKKEFTIIYKFSDVMDNIKANSIEEAKQIAKDRLLSDENPLNDAVCYEVKVEEVK